MYATTADKVGPVTQTGPEVSGEQGLLLEAWQAGAGVMLRRAVTSCHACA